MYENPNLANIVTSMKFISFNYEDIKIEKSRESAKQYLYVFKTQENRLMEFKEESRFDPNQMAFSMENDFSKKFQLEHMSNFLENCYKLTVKKSISPVFALKLLTESILANCFLSFEFATVLTVLTLVRGFFQRGIEKNRPYYWGEDKPEHYEHNSLHSD